MSNIERFLVVWAVFSKVGAVKYTTYNLIITYDINSQKNSFHFSQGFSIFIFKPGQNIFNRVKKSSKIEQRQKTLISLSAYTLWLLLQSFFLVRELRVAQRWKCRGLSNSLKFLSILWGNPHTTVFTLELTTTFTLTLHLWWLKTFAKCFK